MTRPYVWRLLLFLVALLIVFEEWGWQPLADLLGRGTRFRVIARLEYAIARLSPYSALVVFTLPTLLLLPLKLAAVVLVAGGYVVTAAALFIAAKVVATALIARLFILTQPSLMQIGWFAWGYDTLMPWKETLVARVHASWAWRVGRVWKERLKRGVGAEWRRWRPAASPAIASLRRRVGAMMRQVRARWAAPRSGP